jgi:hypothetical protein
MKSSGPPSLTRNNEPVVYYGNTIEQNLETRVVSHESTRCISVTVSSYDTVVVSREADQIK